MAAQTTTLFRARLRAFQNEARGRTGTFRPGVLALGALAAAVVVVLGHFAAPSLLEVPQALLTPDLGGRAPVRGESALEAAFWLDALLTAFFSFRVMESLFRSEKVRALELLPVRPVAILSERVINALAEGALLGAGVGLFFVPLFWHGAPLLAALCIAMGVAAALATAAVTIGTNAWLGVQYGGSSGLGDSYGGHGGAFIYAMPEGLVSIGFVSGLDYRDPMFDPHVAFQQFKRKRVACRMAKFYCSDAIYNMGV